MVSLTGVCVAPAKRWVVGGGEQQAVTVGVDEIEITEDVGSGVMGLCLGYGSDLRCPKSSVGAGFKVDVGNLQQAFVGEKKHRLDTRRGQGEALDVVAGREESMRHEADEASASRSLVGEDGRKAVSPGERHELR